MSTYLPKDMQDSMDAARLAKLRKTSRLRVIAGGATYPVLHLWRSGFSVETDRVPALRGLVDLYDGTRHLYQCLVVASGEEAGETRYEFKRNTPAVDRAPLDHASETPRPVALIPR